MIRCHDNYVNMQLIYVNMQQSNVDMQHSYADMQHSYVRDVYMRFELSCMKTFKSFCRLTYFTLYV